MNAAAVALGDEMEAERMKSLGGGDGDFFLVRTKIFYARCHGRRLIWNHRVEALADTWMFLIGAQ
jgi:hypothetical protein